MKCDPFKPSSRRVHLPFANREVEEPTTIGDSKSPGMRSFGFDLWWTLSQMTFPSVRDEEVQNPNVKTLGACVNG